MVAERIASGGGEIEPRPFFEQEHPRPALRKHVGGDAAARARADDDGVVLRHAVTRNPISAMPVTEVA